MAKDQLTFNDLPAIVGELCDRITSMENLLTDKLSKHHEAKENTHVPLWPCSKLALISKDVIDLLLKGQKR